MKKIFATVSISILFFSCKPGIPKDIIQPEQMEKVLYDIHVVDGYVSILGGQDTAKKVASAFYKGVYKKFNIDSAIYNKSLDYYYKHPPILKKMYDSITVQLTKLKDKSLILENELPKPQFRGMFDKESLDSTILDYQLNRKYNYRTLKKFVYGNEMHDAASPNVELKVAPAVPQILEPVAQPVVVPGKIKDQNKK